MQAVMNMEKSKINRSIVTAIMLIASLPSPLIAAEITNTKENLTQNIFDSSFDLTLKVEDTGWSPTEEQKKLGLDQQKCDHTALP